MTASGGGGRRDAGALTAVVKRRFLEPDRRVLMALVTVWLVPLVVLAAAAPNLVVHWVIGGAIGLAVGKLISTAVLP